MDNCCQREDGVVYFDPVEFGILYPQYAELGANTLCTYFEAATLLLDNTKNSPVRDLGERQMLFYLLVCHIAALRQRGESISGTITGAAEGKVNVSVAPLANANWYNQTACGAIYWQATSKYRLGMRWYGTGKCTR